MALLSDSWLFDIFTFFTAAVVIFVSWVKWSQNYWSRKGLATPPTTFFFGQAKGIFTQKESFGDWTLRLYKYFKNEKKIHGGMYILTSPLYVPLDLEIVKNIMQKDFDHFVDRGMYYHEEVDPLSAHLFSLEGSKWRNLRMKLTPTFTSGRMKMMFETLVKCGDQLKELMDKNVNKGPLDTKDAMGRFTTDIIGNCAFGIDCNSLKNPDNEVNNLLKSFFVESFWGNINTFLAFLAPRLARKMNVKITKPKLAKFFMEMIEDTVKYREKNNIYRKDFMHLLLQLKNRGKLDDDGKIFEEQTTKGDVTLTMNELAAQAFLFFLAGFETSSTTLTFCLFELAQNQEVQENLRQEVEKVLKKYDNQVTYDGIMEMTYMEKAVNETLRKYPPVSSLDRIATKEYKVPGTDIVLEKGTKVSIPVMGIQYDPDYYPDPDKFDPDRFSEENKKKRHPYTFLPFGEGPRVCIGLRFGMMQVKVGLTVLLKNYKVILNSKTKLPLKFDPKNGVLSPEGGIWLDYESLQH